MAKEIMVDVAKVKIAGVVDMRNAAPVTVDCSIGDCLVLNLSFEYVEVSRNIDHYRLRLESDLDGRAADMAEHVGRDRLTLKDDRQGTLQHRYEVTEPGESEIYFKATSEYTEMMTLKDTEVIEGNIRILVAPTQTAEPLV